MRLYNSWCLEIGERYALLMRANKPETAVQSSGPFSPGTTWIVHHVDALAGYWRLLASLPWPNPPCQLPECGFLARVLVSD